MVHVYPKENRGPRQSMNERHASIAKITRPNFTGIFPRKRLFRLVDSFRKYPVIWITGPAGSGKTTLISSYLDAYKLSCLWYQVDERDSDIATFFSYMGVAAKQAAPRKRKPLPLLTPEYLQGISTFTLRYFENLFARFKPPFIFVFDNYHSVPADSSFHNMLNDGLSAIPDGMNVIIISRHGLPPALSRLHANGLIGMLGWDELRLTLEETAGIVPLRTKQVRSKNTARQLHLATGGWVAGLVLMLEAIQRGSDPHVLGQLPQGEIVDYFGNEFFNKIDEVVQEFLLKTAFLSRMTVKMAEELTGFQNAGNILSTLSRNNYFTEKYYDTEPAYQYHPLLREFLMARAKKTFSMEEMSFIKRRAAHLLAKSGRYEEAAVLFLEDRAWAEMTNLILEQAHSLIIQGRFASLQDWLIHLPQEVREENPWLQYWMGVSTLPSVPLSGKTCFERAFTKFQADNDTIGSLLAASGMVNAIAYGYEDFTLFEHWFPVLTGLAAKIEDFPSDEIEASVTTAIIMASTLYENPCQEAETWAQRALALRETPVTANQKLLALYYLFWNKLFTRGPHYSLHILDELRRLSRSPHAHPMGLIMVCLAEALYYCHQGLHGETIAAVNKGIRLSSETGIHIQDIWLYHQAVYSFLSRMDVKGARIWLNKIESVINTCPVWARSAHYCLLAQEGLALGDFNRALFQAERALELSAKAGSQLSTVLNHILLAQILHKLGRNHESQQHHMATTAIATQFNFATLRVSTLLFDAHVAFENDEEEKGQQSLHQALKLSRELGFLGFFDPVMMVGMCEKALQAGIEVDYVQETIRRRALILAPPPLHIDLWPWPLKIYTLGKFELLKDGKPLSFSRKVQKKPLLMLKALIAQGGKEVKEEQLSDMLWPEADGDQAYSAFRTTLSRLRQLIGNEKAIGYHDGKATIDPRYCWVDAWAFDRIFGQIEAESKSLEKGETGTCGGVEKVVRLIEKAIDTYKGHFLADESEELWTTSYRERLRNKYLLLITRLGNYLQKKEQWEKAVEDYRKALEVDSLAEEFYQPLMICYKHLGQNAKAIEVYKRCKKVLTSVLGIEPSPKTETIYKSIISSRLP